MATTETQAKPKLREIALTFDDCPRKIGPLMGGMERAQHLIEELKKAKVARVAFFCNSPAREADGNERLRLFAEQGHIIANHSASHPDLYKVPIETYLKDIDQADQELKDLPNFRKWFRFPYLHEGKTPADVRRVREHLIQKGYKQGYVTVDNQDWYVDELLRKEIEKGNTYNRDKLCKVYSRMMTDDADFYDKMSVQALGRSVKHVMLLHETDLNAVCIGALVTALRKQQWQIISPDVAFSDPIANKEPAATTKLNQGRVFALAKENNYKGAYWSKWNEESEIDKEFARSKVWQTIPDKNRKSAKLPSEGHRL